MGKIKKRSGNSGKTIKPTEDTAEKTDIAHPVFCLRYLNKKYHVDACEAAEKIKFLERMCHLSSFTWQELRLASRKGVGAEKIDQSAIKGAAIPTHLSKDEVLFAYRFDGNKPMVGYRRGYVFHVVYIDRDFTLYDH